MSYTLNTDLNYDKAHGQELAVETDKNTKERNTYPRLITVIIINMLLNHIQLFTLGF